jgi:hypothetical protein
MRWSDRRVSSRRCRVVELTLVAKDLRTARALTAQVLRDPPVVVATGSTSGD